MDSIDVTEIIFRSRMSNYMLACYKAGTSSVLLLSLTSWIYRPISSERDGRMDESMDSACGRKAKTHLKTLIKLHRCAFQKANARCISKKFLQITCGRSLVSSLE